MKRHSVFALLFLLFLGGCDFQAYIDLSFSHVMRVLQWKAGSAIPSRALIRIQMASEEGCEQDKSRVAEILSRYYGVPESLLCKEEGLSIYLEATVPLNVSRRSGEINKKITAIQLEETADGIEIRVAMDRGSFERMQNEMEEVFFRKPEVNDLSLILRFRNDTRQTLISTAKFVYVDDRPLPMESKVNLDPGRTVEIRLSDVARDYVYQQGVLTVLTVKGTVEGKPFSEIEFLPATEAQPSKPAKPSETRSTDQARPGREEEGRPASSNKPSSGPSDARLKSKDFEAIQGKMEELMKQETAVGGK
ncbi:MAG: hypothetical protein KDK23_10740 [Leptospiraceae bacterium]|nr:hypothetical protein [Leptospiraceae bacterium]